MWKSWGDKYAIVKYDEKERHRKIKRTNIIVAIVVIADVLTGHFIFANMQPEDGLFYKLIPSMAAVFSVIVCLVLFFLKWKKNNKECDLALMAASIIFAFMTYIAFPYSM